MACYHPMVAFKDYDSGLTENGRFRFKLNGSFDPMYVEMYPKGDVIKVPCGKCLGCQLDYSRTWADRMYLEYLSNDKKAIFVTLTYDEEHAPPGFIDELTGEVVNLSLSKRDTQLFWKNLRDHYPEKKIRYYLCGEYGPRTKRPHYHAIIFGICLEDFKDLVYWKENELNQPYFLSKEFEDIWKNGFISISPVTYKTCAYVARYVMKKALKEEAPFDCEPEFRTMSRRPGIAADYLKDKPDVVYNNHIYFNDGNESYEICVPKYFIQKLKLTNPDAYDKVINERRSLSHDRDLLKLQQTELSYPEILDKEERDLFNKTQILFKLRKEV